MKAKYYDIRDDLAAYPLAWCYLIWSKRGPGKTYSTLRMCIEDNKIFAFMKKNDDYTDYDIIEVIEWDYIDVIKEFKNKHNWEY